MATYSIDQKRINRLKLQLDGKNASAKTSNHPTPIQSSAQLVASDEIYLKKDLFKSFSLAFLAIGLQFVLFLAQKNHLFLGFN